MQALKTPLPLRVAVLLHGVAPARWAGCLRVLSQVQATAAVAGVSGVPVNLVVQPSRHRLALPPLFARWLQRLAQHGHHVLLQTSDTAAPDDAVAWAAANDVPLTGLLAPTARPLAFDARSRCHTAWSVLRHATVARWQLQRQAPLLQLDLQPGDADNDFVRRCWAATLHGALQQQRLPQCADCVAATGMDTLPGTHRVLPQRSATV